MIEKCEVCGKEAQHAVRDFETHGEIGVVVATPFEDIHYFCDEHKRESIEYDLGVWW